MIRKGILTRISNFHILIAVFSLFLLLKCAISFAAVPLPGSVYPSRIPQTVPRPQQVSRALAPVKTAQQAAPSLGPEAAKIKFPLEKVILEGNTVYSDQQLSALYQDKIGTVISVADLMNIVQSITNFYRNNGYILSRAVLPPQHIEHGTVHIRIVEGYIDQVNILGSPKNAKPLLESYAIRIQQSKPLKLQVMERYLYLANDIPGMQVQSVLEPSKTKNLSVADLNMIANQRYFTGYISYDDFQSRYLGPLETTGNFNVNSGFIPGDSMHFTYLTSTKFPRLHYDDISYETPLGTKGLRVLFGGNESVTSPGFVLTPTVLNGDSKDYYGTLTYPVLRSRSNNLTLDGGFLYVDSTETFSKADLQLYTDHIRSLRAGGSYDFYDRFNGSNLLIAHIEKGFPIWGATTNPTSTTTSRFGATANFIKLTAQATRVQQLSGPFQAYITLQGQEAFVPLLVYEQYGYGGAILGRGYDPSELLGDQGLAGTVELRYNAYPAWKVLQSAQLFAFFDAGVVWNRKTAGGLSSKISANSTGVGVRFNFTSNLSGTWTIAQPLTKQESTLELIGRGKVPRTLFSITAST